MKVAQLEAVQGLSKQGGGGGCSFAVVTRVVTKSQRVSASPRTLT